MDSSASSRRKLLPFVPDVPYHIQAVFAMTFYYIWSRALQDDYLEDLSKLTEEQRQAIHVSNYRIAVRRMEKTNDCVFCF